MRRFRRQADECLAGEVLLAAVTGDVGERARKPDVSLVAAVAVIGYRKTRWNSQQQLRRSFGKIAPQHCDLGTGGQGLELQRSPLQAARVGDRLLRSERGK